MSKVRFVDSNITISPGAGGTSHAAISASYALSASYADYAVSASHEIVKEVSSSYADTASYAVTASYALNAGTGGGSGIFTKTGSYYATTNDLQVTGSLRVRDLYARDGRFSRDGGAAEIEIIASEIAGGIIGTQTSDNLLFRRFNIPKFTISESRNFSHQNLDVQGQVSASTNLFAKQLYVEDQLAIDYSNGIAIGNVTDPIRLINDVTITGSLTVSGPSYFESGSITLDRTTLPSLPGDSDKINIGTGGSGAPYKAFQIYTNGGYVIIGPQNDTYSHFSTDRSKFYFNKPLQVSGEVMSHTGEDLVLGNNGGTSDTITIAQNDIIFELNNQNIFHMTTGSAGGILSGSAASTASFGIYLGDGSQLENLPETNPKYLIYQTGSSSNNIQPISGSNLTTGNYSVIGGGLSNFVSESLYATIGGGTENTASACGVTIGGGCKNKATCFFYSSILGGLGNHACAAYSSVGGGSNNRINSSGGFSTIAGGSTNCITQTYSAIGGGYQNCITGNSDQSVVAGGRCNIIEGNPSNYSIIGGGFNNNINTSECSGIFGGVDNTITNHTSSFIIGSNITANASCTTFVNNLNVSSSITASGNISSSGTMFGSLLDINGSDMRIGVYNTGLGDSFNIGSTTQDVFISSKAFGTASLNSTFGITKISSTNGKVQLGENASTVELFTTTTISGSLSISGSLLNTGTVSYDHTLSPYTLTGTEQFVLINPSGGDVTINMPDAATYPGRQIFFKLTQAAGANTVTLQRQGADTIDGATTYTDLDIQYESISVVSNGSNGWFIF